MTVTLPDELARRVANELPGLNCSAAFQEALIARPISRQDNRSGLYEMGRRACAGLHAENGPVGLRGLKKRQKAIELRYDDARRQRLQAQVDRLRLLRVRPL
jgi:hypothetical protein